jgi:novobiocin biosynthesis protein NovU/D-mycarose 3-C-methyltransferase
MAEHTHCRICGTRLPAPFLDLGRMPLANSFLKSPKEFAGEPAYSLAVAGCVACGLVQLDYVVPAEQLYRNYIYVSSTSDAVRQHADALAARLTRRYGWSAKALVVEVGSNDGTVLKAFQRRGTRVLGVEPARNIAALAERDGVPTVAEFFNGATAAAEHERVGEAAALLGRHVFAHVDDVHDFMKGAAGWLAKDGVLVIEVPYLGELVDRLEFDTVYHEHLSYIALRPMERLCAQHGLQLVDVEPIELHGGSVIMHVRRREAGDAPSGTLRAMLADEDRRGLGRPETLAAFGRRVETWRDRFQDFVAGLRRGGANIIGYGAAAKANTLLNYCPDVARSLRMILDKSPHKHGHFTPGTHIPVEPVERWTTDPATHMLVLAWNFRDEIMRQLAPFAARGGRFVIPIPEPVVV